MNMERRIEKLIILLVVMAFTPITLKAAPSISSVSNSVIVNGGNVTVTGSSFGIKGNASPVRYDFFEQNDNTYSNGQPVTNGGWSTVYGSQFITPIYSTSSPKPGSTKFARALHQNTPAGYNDSIFYYDGGNTSLSPVYITFYYRRIHAAGSETDNNKWFRITENAADGTGDAPCLYHTFLNEIGGAGANTSGNKGEPNTSLGTYWHSMPPYETWIRWEGYYVKGDGGTPNGTMIENAWYGEGQRFRNIVNAVGTEQTDTAGSTSQWHDIIFGGYCRLGSLAGGADPSMVYYSDFDDIYIDNTRARVEIGNNASWSQCTRREIQIPTSWTENSISINVNSGSFANGQAAYLFVVDADGNISNGFPIVFGESGNGTVPTQDTQAPQNPSGVNVTVQ